MDVNYSCEIPDVKTEDIVLSGECGSLLVTGILNGAVIVRAPSKLQIRGIMNGNLTVDEGASAEIRGILKANSIICSGVLDVYGIVTCETGVPSNAVLHKGCIVNSVQY